MSEMKNIIKSINQWQADGQKVAMATVVSIKGSAYRRPGARMVICEDGQSIGMLGGGCFDADVKEIALQVLKTGKPQLHLYNLMDVDVWDLGLGCNGSVFILIESLSVIQGNEMLRKIEASIQNRKYLMIQHKFSKRMEYHSRFINGEIELSRVYKEYDKENKYHYSDCDFCEWVEPDPRLVIFGAGHDVLPVVDFAHQAGFEVSIVDPRSAFLNKDRFPSASEFICSRPEDYHTKISPKENDYVLFMTHNINFDTEAYNFYRQFTVSYLGFLGPRHRCDRILNSLPNDGNRNKELIHSPIGIDIGSETAEQVALSIVSELMAVKNKRKPIFLREKNSTIHAPVIVNS